MNPNVKAHWHNGLAGPYTSGYDPEELDEYEFDEIAKAGFSEVWYWYGRGSWEGTGYAILRKNGDDGIYVHYMGHCSCDGPTENIGDADRWESLESLKASATEQLLAELDPLITMMEEKR